MKSALLTGASSGLGRALAPLLLEQGYRVALVGKNPHRLEITQAGLSREAASVICDLNIPTEVAGLVEKCRSALKLTQPFDLLVNCAGISVTGLVDSIPFEEIERIHRVNFLSPVSLIQQVLPEMKRAGKGRIVNVTSGVALRALPFVSPYASAKASLNAFTDSLAVELKGTGISTLLFSPGPVASRFHDNMVHHGPGKLDFPPFYGEPPEKIAKKLLQAIESKKSRVRLGTRSAIAKHLQYWSPPLSDLVTSRLYRLSVSSKL